MKISVIIVTKDRKEDVRDTIAGFMKQTYSNKEIIVIDNASKDGTREMMQNDFAEIKYMWLPDNFDIRSINIGIELSDGDIIWRTDSDSYPESPDTFDLVASIFSNYSDIHIISTEDIEVSKNYAVWDWYPLDIDKTKIPEKGFKAHAFPGTGAAIRRSVYNKIGGFWEFGFEEIDFCTRAINAGFNIRYFPNIRTLHFASPRERDSAARWVQISKQFVRYTWKYFPFFRAFGRTILIMFFQVFIGILYRIPFLSLIEGILAMKTVIFTTVRTERQVLSRNVLHDATLGIGIFRTQMKFFREIISKNMNKWKKN